MASFRYAFLISSGVAVVPNAQDLVVVFVDHVVVAFTSSAPEDTHGGCVGASASMMFEARYSATFTCAGRNNSSFRDILDAEPQQRFLVPHWCVLSWLRLRAGRGERLTHRLEGANSVRLQQCNNLFVDDLHPVHQGLLPWLVHLKALSRSSTMLRRERSTSRLPSSASLLPSRSMRRR